MRERFPEIVHLVLAELEIDNIAAYCDTLEVGAHNIHGSVHAPKHPSIPIDSNQLIRLDGGIEDSL
jgi:hypothetical protein